jgi:hypothetical protein
MTIAQSPYRRIYAIPDIHGTSTLLRKAIKLIRAHGYDKQTDMIIFLGDYIDRGPDTPGVIDIVRNMVDKGFAKAIRGNHDDFAVNVYVKYSLTAALDWEANNRWITDEQYPNKRMSEDHVRFLGSLPYAIEMQGFFFSHAPVLREKHRKPGPYHVDELTWTKFGPECEKPGGMMDKHEGPKSDCGVGETHLIGICGHIHQSRDFVRRFPMYRMLDAGCGCSWGKLAVHECIENITFYAEHDK